MKTSYHLKACQVGASEAHNKREKELDYVRKDLTHLNQSYSYIPHSLQTEEANIKKEVKLKTGRKLQKNAVPIKEGVLVIKQDTTIDELKAFCDECQKRYGIVPLQIHTHMDEGHRDKETGEWKPNLHAHVVWRMYDKEGRNVRLQRFDLSDMQDIAAQCLNMERGKKSNKKHKESLEFKIEQLEKELQDSKKEMLDLKRDNALLIAENERIRKENTKLNAVFKGTLEGVSDLFVGKTRKRLKETENELRERKNKHIEDNRKANVEIHRQRDLITDLKKQVGDTEELKNKVDRWKANYDDMKQQKEEVENFWNDVYRLGLSTQQAMQLKKEKKLILPSLTLPDGTLIQREDKTPIRLQYGWISDIYNKVNAITAYLACSFERVGTWLREVERSPWFRINGQSNDRKRGYQNRMG